MSHLIVENLSKSFGGVQAVSGVSLEVKEREIIGVIGPNGAGKSTLFNLITGVYVPDTEASNSAEKNWSVASNTKLLAQVLDEHSKISVFSKD